MEKTISHASYIIAIIKSMFSAWHLKMFTSSFLIVVSFFFDALQRDALLALLALIIMDFLSAILAAYKSNDKITSFRLFNTALKITVYFSIISAAFMTEKAVNIGVIDEILIGFLVVTELVSILENVNKAGYSTPTGLLTTLKTSLSKK